MNKSCGNCRSWHKYPYNNYDHYCMAVDSSETAFQIIEHGTYYGDMRPFLITEPKHYCNEWKSKIEDKEVVK